MRKVWVLAAVAAGWPGMAQTCAPDSFAGAYGFQLSGTTTISGNARPVANMGRLEFDGEGGVSGTSSVNFDGYFLGNPVTGTYEAKGNCSLTWSLQDDSGAWQHFAGTMSADLRRVTFRQTDAGGPQRGTMAKVAADCSGPRGIFDFTIAGTVVPMNPGESGRKVEMSGIVGADDSGQLSVSGSDMRGTATVDEDCIVEITLGAMKFRGVLVDGGREILAIESDPGAIVNARFRAKGKK